MPLRATSRAGRLLPPLAVTAILLVSAPAAAAPADHPYAPAGVAAGEWLAGQLVDGGLPGFVGSDWGLTIDALMALSATGADPTAVEAIGDALADNVDTYAAPAPEFLIAGATAKLLYAAAILDRDPHDFGGHDLRQRTLDLVAGEESEWPGWLRNQQPGGTTGGNMFDQSLAVLGLARTGGVPQLVVDFLVSQQCADGGWRLFPAAAGTPCAELPASEQVMDPDTTGYAVQALLAADSADGAAEAAAAGIAWLQSVQRDFGAFHGSVVTDYPNTNSTGLAGQALAAGGDQTGADLAAGWVAEQQITAAASGAAGDHVGTIAYTPETYATAVADGIPDLQLDQWRRATAQAVLVLAQVPLGQIGLVTPPPLTPTPVPTSPGSPSDPPGSGAGGELPVTGSPVVSLAAVGGLVLLLGVGALLLSRRGRGSAVTR